jgi:hypothetical protein
VAGGGRRAYRRRGYWRGITLGKVESSSAAGSIRFAGTIRPTITTAAPSRRTGSTAPATSCGGHASGNLIAEGRTKDVINRGGEKISAEEVGPPRGLSHHACREGGEEPLARGAPAGAGDAESRDVSTPATAHDIVEEIRQAYDRVGITLDRPATYGTYYRLLCGACGRMLGNVGDKLLSGMATALVDDQFELYASGLLGCPCGHQRLITARLDPARAGAGRARYADAREGERS